MFKRYRALYCGMAQYESCRDQIAQVKREVLLALIFMVLGESLLFFETYPLKVFIDNGLKAKNVLAWAIGMALVVSLGYLVEESLERLGDRWRFRGMWRNYALINYLGARHMLRLGTAWHLEHATAEKESIVTRNHKKIDRLTDEVVFNAAPVTLRIMVATIMCLVIEWRFGLLAIISVVSYCTTIYLIEKKNWPLHEAFRASIKRVEMSETELSSHAITLDEQGLTGIFADNHEAEMLRHLAEEKQRAMTWRHNLGHQIELISVLSGCYYIVAYFSWKAGASIGTLILLSGLLSRIWSQLYRYMELQRSMQEGLPALDEMIELFASRPLVESDESSRQLELVNGTIAFEGVDFQYPGHTTLALAAATFELHAGETVALVGRSGGGKSTLARLLMRLYDPNQGRISLDGFDLRELDLAWLRTDVIGYVPQDNAMLETSIADNIKIGVPHVSQHEVEQAAQAACIHDFIAGLPEGYQSQVGERGLKLSGGQCQRVALARALIKQPRILILDEPTSALDAESQETVMQTLSSLSAGRDMTIIIIAHRYSTIKMADRVIEVDDGRIAAIGAPEELIERGGIYAELRRLEGL